MRFLVDECTGPAVAAWLRAQGHTVFSVFEEARGLDDSRVIAKAAAENWILITNDKGFGEKVFRDRHIHRGVVLLRLDDEQTANKIVTLQRLLDCLGEQLVESFVVATETAVRCVRR